MVERKEKDDQRAEFFDSLGHSTRIKILRTLSEGSLGFSDLKRSLNIDSSGHLAHHLDKLGDLIGKDDYGKYCISDKGKDALLRMQPVEKYSEDVRFREQTGLLIRSLRSDCVGVREIATVQLSLFGPKAVPFLKSALSTALSEIKRLDKYSENQGGSEGAIACLVDVLGIISVPNSVPDIAQALPRVRAFKALAKIGNKQALDAIVPALHAWYLKGEYDQHYWQNKDTDDVEIDSFIRETFSSFEEEGRIALEAALATETFEGKYVIARALAVIGDDKSIPVLASTLETGDFLTKTEAAKALRRLNGTIEVMPKIINELNKTTDSWMAARKTDYYDSDEFRGADDACKVFADIILTSGSIDDWVKIAFHRPRDGRYDNNAESFDKALIDSKEQAVPALAKLLSDPDASVQAAAAEMIAEIKRSNDNSGNDSRKRY